MTDAKSRYLENGIIAAIFNATSLAGLLQNSSAGGVSVITCQLHTASPGDTGNCATSEVSTSNYAAYARVQMERSSSSFTVSTADGTVAFTTDVVFPASTGGTATVTHFSLGINSTVAGSTGNILYYGTVSPNITVTSGIAPRLTTDTVIAEG